MRNILAPSAVQIHQQAGRGKGRRPDALGMLGSLFLAPAIASPPTVRRLLSAAVQVMAVGLGAGLLLERIPGRPSFDTIYAEDYWAFLTQALQHPWHVYIPDAGYEQLLPRLIAQAAIYIPLAQVSRFDAVCGAIIAAICGVFVFHASAGHIRSTPLRALLGTSIVLMPMATMEVADSAVGAPWYLMFATFWALLWRPRTRAGMTMAALVAFAATSSEVVAFLFIPLVAARLFVLRRPRDHLVTAGWLAGCLVQVPAVLSGYFSGHSRLNRQQGTPHNSLAFYAHDTVLPWLGWHFAWWLRSFAGENGGTAIAGAIGVLVLGTILVTQPRNRPFVVICVLTGLIFSIFETTITPRVAIGPVSFASEPGARYSLLPIFLFWAAVMVGADYVLQRQEGEHRRHGTRLRSAAVVSVLAVVLAASWVADFRNPGARSNEDANWGPVAARWEQDCKLSPSGTITVQAGVASAGEVYHTLPCARIRT